MTPYTRTIVQPAAEPLTLDEVKLHLRIDTDDENDWIEPQITAARQAAENFCNRYIAEQTVEMRRAGLPNCWPFAMCLPGSDPARDVVIKYPDANGAQQTVDPGVYQVAWSAPSRIDTAYGMQWPPARYESDGVRITYVAGYTLPGDCPQAYPLPSAIRSAMLLMIGNWYENREANVIGTIVAELPLGVQSLLWPFRLSLGV